MQVEKTSKCEGCPFYRRSKYMVPDEIVPDSEVLIMGQNPDEYGEKGLKITGYNSVGGVITEESPPAPYAGKTGYDMERKYFPLSGLQRGKASIGNVIRCRLDGTNDLPLVTSHEVRQAIEHCARAYGKIPKSTKLIVAEGEYALYGMTGEDGGDAPGHKISRGISGWRGYLLPYNPPPRPRFQYTDIYMPGQDSIPVLATYHLAFLYRNPWYQPASQRDWTRIAHVLKKQWPKPLPEIISVPPETWPRKSAFDTEFVPELNNKLVRYSLYDGKTLWVVEQAENLLFPVVEGEPTIIMHNSDADLPFLPDIIGPYSFKIEDTMYGHSVLWSDLDHDLDFGGSMYGSINRWKHLFRSNPRVYSGGDAVGTWDWWKGMEPEFQRDPRSLNVYNRYQMPLVYIIAKAKQHGMKVHKGRVNLSIKDMQKQLDEATSRAQVQVGWPMNLGSPQQVKLQLFDIEKVHLNPMSGKVRR